MPILADSSAPWRSAILIEGGNDVEPPQQRFTAARTVTRKYARHGDGFEELYDLVADPFELDNKAKDPSYASDAATLRSLDDRLKSCAGASCWYLETGQFDCWRSGRRGIHSDLCQNPSSKSACSTR